MQTFTIGRHTLNDLQVCYKIELQVQENLHEIIS